jgi:simple sugar transport system ATP-binding protein
MQTGRVLDLIRQVRNQGIAVVLISHNMSQVIEIADRVEVLRLGKRVARIERASASIEGLVAAMTSASAQEETLQ